MTLLLVAGAGASRNLGVDDEPMPLMANWSDALCDALNHREAGLAAACGLSNGATGPEFEEQLGLLLRWEKIRDLELRFAGLGGPKPGEVLPKLKAAQRQASQRLEAAMETLKETLFKQFGQARIDDRRAHKAYGFLLENLGRPELIVATTNYDRALEPALAANGYQFDAGFRGPPARMQRLEPTGLVRNRDGTTPVIHLHGAVGWYQQDGHVIEHPAELEFIDRLGTPVVLYPDPDKDPTSDSLVDKLWLEFDLALEEASTVLVIGHSLHDPALVRALIGVADSKPTFITYLEEEGRERISSVVPTAQPVQMSFGPDIEVDHRELLAIRDSIFQK